MKTRTFIWGLIILIIGTFMLYVYGLKLIQGHYSFENWFFTICGVINALNGYDKIDQTTL